MINYLFIPIFMWETWIFLYFFVCSMFFLHFQYDDDDDDHGDAGRTKQKKMEFFFSFQWSSELSLYFRDSSMKLFYQLCRLFFIVVVIFLTFIYIHHMIVKNRKKKTFNVSQERREKNLKKRGIIRVFEDKQFVI
jgi:preprotein translocase subunit SecG